LFNQEERAEKMRKFGWEGTLFVVGSALAAASMPASAAYVVSVSAPDTTIEPGQQFTVNAVLTGPHTIDSFVLLMDVTGPKSLAYNAYQLAGNGPFQTGGPDDFSGPKGAPDTGLLDGLSGRLLNPLITNALYPQTPTRADVKFDATTRPGSTFTQGTIVTMTLTMPTNAVPNQDSFNILAVPDTFAFQGTDFFDATAGPALHITVVPEPATLVLLGLGGLAAARRRFLGA
jgi:PEP-CTERM motif